MFGRHNYLQEKVFIFFTAPKYDNRAMYDFSGKNNINSHLYEFRQRYTFSGTFQLLKSASISRTLTANNVPNLYGVYVISAVVGDSTQCVYIGKAGTLTTSGVWKQQGLKGRLARKQDGEARQIFFQKIIEQHRLDALLFEWFVTYDGKQLLILPALAELVLLQAYFDNCRCLPMLNKAV